MPRYAIGVDIGGTYTKLALVDEDGNIHLRDSIPTPKDPAPELIVDKIIEAGLAFRSEAESKNISVEGVSFAIPHFHDGKDWVQQQTNNMPPLEGFPMRPPLHGAFGPSIAMINDLSATGIAEHLFGKGRDCDRMLLMAIGTGIAISVITEEHGLVHYSWDTAGDTGQIIVDPYGLADCTCGGRGCLEAVASAPAIRRRALREVERGKDTLLAEVMERKGDLEARDVSEAAEAGDEVAKDITDQVGFFLGVALTSYLHIFRPTLIVLGGGVALAGDLLVEPIHHTMNRLASPWYLKRLEGIEISALGKDGGAIGSASLILYPGKYLPQSTPEES
jgi:glucokinase